MDICKSSSSDRVELLQLHIVFSFFIFLGVCVCSWKPPGKMIKAEVEPRDDFSGHSSFHDVTEIPPGAVVVQVDSDNQWFREGSILLHGWSMSGKRAQGVAGQDGRMFALKVAEDDSNLFQICQESRAVRELKAAGFSMGILEFSMQGRLFVSNMRLDCLISFPYGRCLKNNVDDFDLSQVSTFLVSVLKQIHSAGWVHGDIKPSNLIRLDNAECPVSFIDFGASRKSGDDDAQGHFVSTPMYSSIAQNKDYPKRPCYPEDDFESLIYTLGVLDYGNTLLGGKDLSCDDYVDHKFKFLREIYAKPPQWITVELSQIVNSVLSGSCEDDQRTATPKDFRAES